MNLAKRTPVVGVVAGIVFVVFGIIKSNTVFLIVGIVLMVLAFIRRIRK